MYTTSHAQELREKKLKSISKVLYNVWVVERLLQPNYFLSIMNRGQFRLCPLVYTALRTKADRNIINWGLQA